MEEDHPYGFPGLAPYDGYCVTATPEEDEEGRFQISYEIAELDEEDSETAEGDDTEAS